MTTSELEKIFVPHISELSGPVFAGRRLVHYTSAESALKIISGSEIWLRNAVLMNDFSEMRHGLACLHAAWHSDSGLKLRNWLDEKLPGVREELEGAFDSHAEGLTTWTFMLSLSLHDDDEDDFGRLSMWRAYGGKAGVALVLNPTIFASNTDALKVYSAPVVYRDVPAFTRWFESWVGGIMASEDVLLRTGKDEVLAHFFYTLRSFVLCTKHPGFAEEKEWRVFHSPALDGSSPWLKYETEVIAGVPQQIVKVALRDDEQAGVTGVGAGTLLNRLIIGPCENPLPISQAFVAALENAGIQEPANMIGVSFIPLRQH